MRHWYQRKHALLFAITFYVAGVVVYSCLEYLQSRYNGMAHLDHQLVKAASLSDNFLRNELAENITGSKEITTDEDFLLSLSLNELAVRRDVDRIYAMIIDSGKVLFVASSPTPDQLAKGLVGPFFKQPYANPSPLIVEAFLKREPQFENHRTSQGKLRSLYYPLEDRNQKTYVIGIDVSSASVHAIATQSLIQAAIYGVCLGLLVFPLLFLYIKNLKAFYHQKVEVLHHDALTGLPNQRALEQILDESEIDSHLLVIEIENFDHIANVVGVAETDGFVLKLACQLCELSVDGMEYVQIFHVSENRFVLFSQSVLLTDQQIDGIISGAFRVLTGSPLSSGDGKPLPLIVRMGAVRHHSNALVLANMALIYARQTNQSLVVYEESLNLPAYFTRYVKTFNLLDEALKKRRVVLFYQPIFDAKTGKVAKYEALARLTDEAGEIICSPDEFMPIAYQSRLCHKLTRLVIDKVIEEIAETDFIVSVNLSVKDLFDHKTREYVITRLRQHNIGRQVEIELLEQQIMTNYRLAAAYIKQLKSVVHAVGMDDLGRLYSNFDRLFGLPLDFVKIDGMIVETMQRDADARTMVEGVVTFAKQKGMAVVAEHCSSKLICEMVVDMEISLLQGFYIGKPHRTFQLVENFRELPKL